MRKILIQFPGLGRGQLFNETHRDAITDPFVYLRNRLKGIGYHLETVDDHSLTDCSQIWFWDVHDVVDTLTSRTRRLVRTVKRLASRQVQQRNVYQEAVRAGAQNKMVLFIGEPPSVLPANWDARLHEKFPVVFTWHDRYVDGKRYYKYRLPATGKFPVVAPVPFKDKKMAILIARQYKSTHPGELYSARIRSVRCFEEKYPDQFDLYGGGWEGGDVHGRSFPSWRGMVRHKWDVYPRYRFGVTYENVGTEAGYVSEKIFDCMRADCVPVYWGAPNIAEYVDKEAFIDRREFASDEDLATFLHSMSAATYEKYRRAIRAYLGSERFARFLPPAWAEQLIGDLCL